MAEQDGYGNIKASESKSMKKFRDTWAPLYKAVGKAFTPNDEIYEVCAKETFPCQAKKSNPNRLM